MFGAEGVDGGDGVLHLGLQAAPAVSQLIFPQGIVRVSVTLFRSNAKLQCEESRESEESKQAGRRRNGIWAPGPSGMRWHRLFLCFLWNIIVK